MNGITVGFAMCGSFCTLGRALGVMEELAGLGYDIIPIMSTNVYNTDTRFGKATDIINKTQEICGRKVISTIADAEPIGPKGMTDIMLVAPCTGNTAAKLANAVTDTPVTMAVKSHLRSGKPVVLAIASNDSLMGSAKNIGLLFSLKNSMICKNLKILYGNIIIHPYHPVHHASFGIYRSCYCEGSNNTMTWRYRSS